MSRFAKTARVFFFEEPVFEDGQPRLRSSICPETGVQVETPVLPHGLNRSQAIEEQRKLLCGLVASCRIRNYITWYYTPMAREFTCDLKPAVSIYDCMDELSGFVGAPPAMHANETKLFKEVDLVFAGGASLFASKSRQHSSVHLFPSSVDVAHFSTALAAQPEPADQAGIAHPRLGYAGVIDERMDLELIRRVAVAKPDWHFVFLGPVVKIDPASLPSAPNIHYLGMKAYAQLPAYLSGWRIGMLPFALNDSTRFISPTKTPEYLAAGLQVVSTPIRDVVSPYGKNNLAAIAHSSEEFIERVDSFLASPPTTGFRGRVAEFLMHSSWDSTWQNMHKLIREKLEPAIAQPLPSRSADFEGAAHV